MNFMDQSTIGGSRESEPAALSRIGIAFPVKLIVTLRFAKNVIQLGVAQSCNIKEGKLVQDLSSH